MADKKKSSKLLYYLLAFAVLFLVYDNFTSEESLLNLTETKKKIFKKPAQSDTKFNEQQYTTESAALFKYKTWAETNMAEKNPFYIPVKKVVKRVVRPTLSAKVTQIIPGDPPYAEIEGEYLTIGDEFKGWKIIAISEKGVTFQKGSDKVTIGVSS